MFKKIKKEECCNLLDGLECMHCHGKVLIDLAFLAKAETVLVCPYCGNVAEVES